MLVVDCINQDKATSRLIIIALEPVFYKIHYLRTGSILRTLKVNADSQTANKDTWICPSLLTIRNKAIEFYPVLLS